MTAEQWSEVKRMFASALEVAAPERNRWLEDNCADEEIRREVMSLLGSYDESTQFLEEAPARQVHAIERALSIPQAGEWIGPYRLDREIGRGGMGIVFEATQQGDGFEQRVALKLIRAGLGLEELAERFKYERRILARLDHPGIARLQDGGSTRSGLPYLVMEHVDGLPIDKWCEARALSTKERVRLMLDVCDAVGYAHQSLVIHRDLKPSNILVTQEGRAKLLDFGIAKVLSEDNGSERLEQTRTGRYLLTPEYASPEQIKGEAVTTAADIYSLGVLLYSLLSSHRPHDLTGLSTLDAMKRVVETEADPPSRRAEGPARQLLRGDLDNIILKCLRKDPSERYSSAKSLAADLEAWLEGRAVSATAPTLSYRLGKWVRRNRAEAAVVGALVLSILTGTVATAWQARQAYIARERAEARFREVQKLSRSLLFEIHDAVRRLPGAVETRELILRRATDFLDGLAKDAGDDSALKMELAEGYRKLGQVLGSDISENLGRKRDAQAVYEKGLQLAEEAAAAQPGRFEPLAVLDGLLVDTAMLYADLEKKQEWRRTVDRLQQVVDLIGREHTNLARARATHAIDTSQLAMLVTTDKQYDRARELYRRAIAAFDALPAQESKERRVRAQRAFAHKRLGGLMIVAGQLEEAEQNYLRALEIDRALLAENPNETRLRYDLSFALSDLGLIARRRGDHGKSVEYYRQVVAIREAAHREDTKDQRVLFGAGSANCNLAESLRFHKQFAEARLHIARCVHLRLEYAGRSEEKPACYLPGEAFFRFSQLVADESETMVPARRAGMLQEARTLLNKAVESAAACEGNRKQYDEAIAAHRERLEKLGAR